MLLLDFFNLYFYPTSPFKLIEESQLVQEPSGNDPRDLVIHWPSLLFFPRLPSQDIETKKESKQRAGYEKWQAFDLLV